MQEIFVTKSSGEKEPFSEEKVLLAMGKVGVPDSLRPQVLSHVKQGLHPNIKTSDIFNHITEYLRAQDIRASTRFNLKKAIFDLGPTGFPFEKYVARIFESLGYKTQVDTILEGECVSHEVDLIIEKENNKEIAEVKFHNHHGSKTDVQVALYSYARFLDLSKIHKISGLWIVTNTKLSQDAITYAKCKNVKVIAWNYPQNNNLQQLIEKPCLYPITILSSLSSKEKQELLDAGIVLCSDLLSNPLVRQIIPDHNHWQNVQQEAQVVWPLSSNRAI
ncbi:ATPase [Candidatus Parcubacteria bacterium]|nr:MAG: ATPase [Candidatus Parcubacteria bacterium]